MIPYSRLISCNYLILLWFNSFPLLFFGIFSTRNSWLLFSFSGFTSQKSSKFNDISFSFLELRLRVDANEALDFSRECSSYIFDYIYFTVKVQSRNNWEALRSDRLAAEMVASSASRAWMFSCSVWLGVSFDCLINIELYLFLILCSLRLPLSNCTSEAHFLPFSFTISSRARH